MQKTRRNRAALRRLLGGALGAWAVCFLWTAGAEAGVIVPGASASGMSAAAGDSSHSPDGSDRLHERDVVRLTVFTPTNGGASSTGTSTSVVSSAGAAVAFAAAYSLSPPQLCGRLLGERKLIIPSAPLFDFLRPPCAA